MKTADVDDGGAELLDIESFDVELTILVDVETVLATDEVCVLDRMCVLDEFVELVVLEIEVPVAGAIIPS